jgi:hypothetical protein
MKTVAKNLLAPIGLACLMLMAPWVFAGDSFPGQAPSNNLLKTQQKADSLFEKGEYERAMFIYREELAPLGDKFAQYMVGYMNYSGRGVPEDSVAASAWYRLAAERGEANYVKVRDLLFSKLNDEQRENSASLYAELRAQMGDIVLVSRLVEQDILILRRRRGGDERFQEQFDRSNFAHNSSVYNEAAASLELRVDYLLELVAADESSSDIEREQVDKLVADARREIDIHNAGL